MHGPGARGPCTLSNRPPIHGTGSLEPAPSASSGPQGIVQGLLELLRRLVLPLRYEFLVVRLRKGLTDELERFGSMVGSPLRIGWH